VKRNLECRRYSREEMKAGEETRMKKTNDAREEERKKENENRRRKKTSLKRHTGRKNMHKERQMEGRKRRNVLRRDDFKCTRAENTSWTKRRALRN